MADDLDRASEYEEMERQNAIRSALKEEPELKANGRCHHCEGFLDDTRRFCNAECRDGWEWNQSAFRRRTGWF